MSGPGRAGILCYARRCGEVTGSVPTATAGREYGPFVTATAHFCPRLDALTPEWAEPMVPHVCVYTLWMCTACHMSR